MARGLYAFTVLAWLVLVWCLPGLVEARGPAVSVRLAIILSWTWPVLLASVVAWGYGRRKERRPLARAGRNCLIFSLGMVLLLVLAW